MLFFCSHKLFFFANKIDQNIEKKEALNKITTIQNLNGNAYINSKYKWASMALHKSKYSK
jgi:hypothetical protein